MGFMQIHRDINRPDSWEFFVFKYNVHIMVNVDSVTVY